MPDSLHDKVEGLKRLNPACVCPSCGKGELDRGSYRGRCRVCDCFFAVPPEGLTPGEWNALPSREKWRTSREGCLIETVRLSDLLALLDQPELGEDCERPNNDGGNGLSEDDRRRLREVLEYAEGQLRGGVAVQAVPPENVLRAYNAIDAALNKNTEEEDRG